MPSCHRRPNKEPECPIRPPSDTTQASCYLNRRPTRSVGMWSNRSGIVTTISRNPWLRAQFVAQQVEHCGHACGGRAISPLEPKHLKRCRRRSIYGRRRCALSEGPGRFIWGKQRRAMAALPTGPRETQSVLKAWRRKARAGPGISQACHDGMHISANRQPAGLWPTEKPCRPSCCDWGSGDLRCRLLHAWMVVRGAAQGLMPVDG